jgi:hypothetical protein
MGRLSTVSDRGVDLDVVVVGIDCDSDDKDRRSLLVGTTVPEDNRNPSAGEIVAT